MCLTTGTETLRQRKFVSSPDETTNLGGANRNILPLLSAPATDIIKMDNRQKLLKEPTWSATVPFYPPSTKYWLIGNTWFDLSNFDHPGGKQILEIARDRFEDATFAFEAHHHDYQRARKIIQKYRVPDEVVAKEGLAMRPTREESKEARFQGPRPTHHDSCLDANKHPDLSDDDAFYSVLRQRVAKYLREVDCKNGEPTWECVYFFWTVFATWCLLMSLTYHTGSFLAAAVTGLIGAVLCSFGHNWVHQPKYKRWGWAMISMDVNGYTSEAWYRDHVLQHHMYTNTPWDHNVHAMEPFIIADAMTSRNWFQQYISPYLLHGFFSVGTYFNYFFHTLWWLQGTENWTVGKPIFLIEHYLFWQKWGWQGLALMFTYNAVVANYFFTLSFMNHNAESAKLVKLRNESKDWGEAQLHSCADWSVHLSFIPSMIYLGLNFHTVHHLFPKVDFSHLPAIHRILEETCADFGIEYTHYPSPGKLYHNMLQTFSTNHSVMQEILVYAGGL